MHLPNGRFVRNSLNLMGFALALFALLLALFGADTEDAFASRHGGQTGPLGYGNREYTPPPRGDFGGYVWGVVLVDGQPVTDATVTMNYQGRSLTVSTMIITDVHPYAIYMFGILPFSELDAKIGATVTMVAQVSGLVSDPRIVTLEPNRDNEVYQEFYFGIKKPTPTPTLPPPPLPPATDTFTTVVPNRLIAVSREHSCVIANNGGLQCWGHNYYGQLGNGTSGNSNVLNRIYDTPVSVLGLGEGVRAVSTGYGHSCAVLQSGSVKCWGYYAYDFQLNSQRPYVTGIPYDKPQITNAIDIATGYFHNCVLLVDRTVKCWGANNYGQLGRGTISGSDAITTTTEPVTVVTGNGSNTPLRNVTAIAANSYATCAIVDTRVKCWGDSRQLGAVGISHSSIPVDIAALGDGVIAIDVGEYAVCAIKADTTVWCWGTSLYPLPLASPDQRGVPMRITGLPRDIVKVVTSMWHACALRQNGTILCWGKGELEQLTGQLGPDILSVAFTPTVIAGVTDVVDIATGKNNVCARLANGTATCWGSNQWGQLGNGAGVRYPFPYGTPAEVQVLNQPARSVATGGYHTCAITDSNGAICWGSNNYGQLGSGTVSHIITQAVPVSGLSNGVAAISAGEHHSCALTNVGGVWCWGRNTHGQLGTGTNLDSAAPLPVTGLISGVQAIASGFNHNCALLIAGTLRCWGANSVGELGSGTNSPTVIPFPVAVQGLEGRRVLSVTAHTHHTCAIVEGGSAHCWGYNNYGQLGIPITTTISTTPITVTGLTSGTTAIAAGDGHSCAVVNGGARCWGWGASGQLGDGINDTSNGGSHIRDVPIQVTNLTSNTVDIRVGSHASCATLVDGSMRCWGQGALGTLGDGRSATSLIPTPVTGLPDRVVQFDLERSHVCAYLANLSLYCWGSDLYGQIGNGQVGFSSRPVNVQNITPAKWTYMLYLVGDNDLSEALNQVSRILDKWEKEAGNRSALNIAVFFDGQGDNDSYIWSTRNVGSERWHLNEEKTSLGDPQNLASFIKWARNNYPAEHYYLSIANHGRATTGIGWDSQSGADHLNALTPAEIHEALYEATLQGTQKIDILHFDACLMALLEMAYEVKDVAKYMIASQNLTAAFYPYDEYAKLVTANPQITAPELAVGIAERYFNHKYLLVNQQPRTISVLDLQQIEPVITALDTFAGGLSVNKELVKSVREQVQVFDSSPDFNQKPPTYYTLTPDDEYVDLRDLAMRLPNISGAVALQQLLEEGRGFVLYSEAVTGIDKLVSGKEWQLDGSNGVSIFFPRSENVWDYPEYISEMEPIFTFNAVSQWDDFLRAYFNQAVPSQDDLKDPGIPPVLKPTKPITTHCGENQLCLWGAVYVDTFEQEGAQVTLQVGNSTWETTTTYKDENEAYPTYAFVVDPVLIPNGAELKLSAQGVYSKQQYLIDYTTRLALSRNEVEVNLHKVTSSAIPTLPTTIPTQVSILWAQLVTSTNASGEQILTGIAQGRVNNLANIVEYRWESNLDEIIASTSSFLFPVQALSPGMHRITLTVRTDNGVTSEPKTFDIHIPTPQPPVISILSPRANATFPAGTTVAVEATATDSDGTIEQVEFLVDNAIVCTATIAPYHCDIMLAEGEHTLAARATDSQGLSTTGTPVTITVVAPSPITVTISQPSGTSEILVNVAIMITAEVSGDGVQQVEFLVNDTSICTISAPPYTCIWRPETAGSYALLARAQTFTETVDSAPVSINVTNPNPNHRIYLPLLMR